jgi:predicted hydrocarbon binding protein
MARDLPRELEFEHPSLEERHRRALSGYMRRIRDLYDAIHDRFGEEGLELIRDVSRAYGTRIAENVKKTRDLSGVDEVGSYLLKVFEMVSGDVEVVEHNDERLVIRVDRCPYPFTREAVCRAHTCMEEALISTLDDSLEHHVGRCLPAGDECCEHIVRRRPV